MSDIFISYKREEQPQAKVLAVALERQGWSVWWDPKLRAGEHFDDVIERALREAKCVIVLWSRRSVESRYIRDEATYALNREKLVPVAIEDVRPPFRFEGLQTARLSDWDGSGTSGEYQKLVQDLRSVLGAPPAAPAERKGSPKDCSRRQRLQKPTPSGMQDRQQAEFSKKVKEFLDSTQPLATVAATATAPVLNIEDIKLRSAAPEQVKPFDFGFFAGGKSSLPPGLNSYDPGKDAYNSACDFASKSDWPHAFEKLKDALILHHFEARMMLSTTWCPHCSTHVPEPSPDSIVDFARFWRGRCPRCQRHLQFRKQ
jgi:hypothetical protein